MSQSQNPIVSKLDPVIPSVIVSTWLLLVALGCGQLTNLHATWWGMAGVTVCAVLLAH